MRHFSCDLCGKDLTPPTDARFILRMEVSAAPAPLSEEDLEPDHLETMAEMLADLEADPDSHDLAPPTRRLEFDLCPRCQRKFVADPLGRDATRKLRFSKN